MDKPGLKSAGLGETGLGETGLGSAGFRETGSGLVGLDADACVFGFLISRRDSESLRRRFWLWVEECAFDFDPAAMVS